MGSSSPLVGRARERQLLEEAAERARTGNPSALIVHGEPGVGKTRLVTEFVADLSEQGFQVLSGRCVRFAAEASSFLPIGQALGARLDLTDPEAGPVMHRVGEAVGELMGSGPVALFVDDLQWADLSSLDVLTYLVAGFSPGQRLLLVGSYRDTELGPGHPLHTWLADLCRMPEVAFVRLGRLDRHDTELLVDGLLGPGRHAVLAAQAFERSQGNPYLTELLVQHLQPTADRVPQGVTGELRQALLAAWHRLPDPTRQLMQVLAVGGLPVEVGVLRQVAGAVGLDADQAAAGLAQAAAAGLAVVDGTGAVWFHHPLVAEVLVSTLLPPDATRLHAEYVRAWEATQRAAEHVRAAHLALHCEGAGDRSAALTWSLRAADAAERVRGYTEESHHLDRACRLWPDADEQARGAGGEYVDLLLRATRAAHRAGDLDTALMLGERAYTLTANDEDPLRRCRVLNELNPLRALHGTDWSLTTWREAVELSSGFPGSREHVRALAELAWQERRQSSPDAVDHAAEALRAARDCGSDEVLAYALNAVANTRADEPDSLALAEEALALARRTGNASLISHSAMAWANCIQGIGRAAEAGPFLLKVYAELVRAGAPHEAGKVAVHAASHLLIIGDWQRCRELLRDAMSIRMANSWSRRARLVAAALAARSGQLSAAEQHLGRAGELATAGGGGLDDWFITAAVDALVAQGAYSDAVTLITREIEAVLDFDWMLSQDLLARAAAASADLCEHHPRQRRAAITGLDALEAIATHVEPALFEPETPDDWFTVAFGALYAAHRSRTTAGHGGDIDAWRHAVQACDAATLPWEAAAARYRLAAALLAQRGSRSRAGTVLREGLRVATDLGAEPLRADIEALAVQAHVSLAEPDTDTVPREGVLGGLTKREHEVLAHLLAGRTYAQIAATLFISEKTVGAHVSNLLRKTGTTNRIELAAFARQRSDSREERATNPLRPPKRGEPGAEGMSR